MMVCDVSTPDGGWLAAARPVPSPNWDERQAGPVELLVIHNISLPPQQYGGPGIVQLFTNCLDADEHPYYAAIAHLRVSAHFLIRRDGELLQFVATDKRAWHAGASNWRGRERCNDFSIGIELEGSDFDAFTEAQYSVLRDLVQCLKQRHPLLELAAHSAIAPGRKTDPGPFFEWQRLADCGLPVYCP